MAQSDPRSQVRDRRVKRGRAGLSIDAATVLFDRYARALFGRAVGRLPAPSLLLAWLDWALSMARSPANSARFDTNGPRSSVAPRRST
ncbi:poly-beta-hydroxybutyrate polymerase N-terminal domain-containing protein [Paraburkholderia diazotrophica]|uniref:poly-beta-hydroxybutyrate polymerase N-terminal domain-containing protein n=1 Tax=Paraburkholderia diazotrophica TaxID=667676 RepID=UPI0015A61E10